jgi:hypothetical protein
VENGDIDQAVENQGLPEFACEETATAGRKSKFSWVKKRVTGVPLRYPRLRSRRECDVARRDSAARAIDLAEQATTTS